MYHYSFLSIRAEYNFSTSYIVETETKLLLYHLFYQEMITNLVI